MAKSSKRDVLKTFRNKAGLVAITRNSAGPMKDRRKKRRGGRKAWKKDLEKDGLAW
jgi:hypothetical protein